jgi:LmbE family N-acetylglucosaminyl deacetylase
MNVFLSPHNDDETLFGSFTIIREQPRVVIVFEGDPRSGDPVTRTDESYRALKELIGEPYFEQWQIQQEAADIRECSAGKHREIELAMRMLDQREAPEKVWAPAISPCGNAEHVAVGTIALAVFGKRVQPYHTYHGGKKVVQQNKPVPYEPEWIARKHRALACYASQFEKAGRHFMEDLREWYA